MAKGNGIDLEYFSMKKEKVRKSELTREKQRLLWEVKDMLKRDIADKLYAIVIQRFHEEQPERKLTNDEMSSIWYEIYGKLCRGESETDIEEWCKITP